MEPKSLLEHLEATTCTIIVLEKRKKLKSVCIVHIITFKAVFGWLPLLFDFSHGANF